MGRPKRIQVIREGLRARVLVDGQELLPNAIPGDSDVTVDVRPDEMPTVRITLMADQVDVINTVHEEAVQ